MQTSRFSIKMIVGILPVIAVTILLLNISSCTEKKATDSACLTLTKGQLENWFPASGPVPNSIAYIHFFPKFNETEKKYEVTAKAFNNAGAQVGEELTLNTGSGCVLPDPIPQIALYYQVSVSDLNILNADGALIANLDELQITPVVYTWESVNYLQLDVDAEIGGVTEDRVAVLPCPPCVNCRPPCPTYCEPACDSIPPPQDSLISQKDSLSNTK